MGCAGQTCLPRTPHSHPVTIEKAPSAQICLRESGPACRLRADAEARGKHAGWFSLQPADTAGACSTHQAGGPRVPKGPATRGLTGSSQTLFSLGCGAEASGWNEQCRNTKERECMIHSPASISRFQIGLVIPLSCTSKDCEGAQGTGPSENSWQQWHYTLRGESTVFAQPV